MSVKLKCYFCGKEIQIPDEYYDETDNYCCGKCLETKGKYSPYNWREIEEG